MMRERILPEARVTYAPGDSFFARELEPNHFRIGYSCMSDENIVLGASQMGRILQ